MNCKQGDLAVLVRARFDPSQLGKIVRVVQWVMTLDGPGWEVNPPLVTNGMEWVAVKDQALRPIRDPGDDAQDESKAWLPPVPTKEHA